MSTAMTPRAALPYGGVGTPAQPTFLTVPSATAVKQIATQLTTGYWQFNGETPAKFAVKTGGTLNVDLSDLSASGRALAEMALAIWSAASGILFNAAPASGAPIHLTFGEDQQGAWCSHATSGAVVTSAHVNVGTDWIARYGTGIDGYSLQTYVHEIGHALGLGHAGNYNGSASFPRDALFAEDSWQMSIMSYFTQSQNRNTGASFAWTLTPMLADLSAIQTLYGVNSKAYAGATTYGVGSTAGALHTAIAALMADGTLSQPIAMTIFDKSGIDTFDFSTDAANQSINLTPGAASSIYGLVGNLLIEGTTIIENVVAGAGNDAVRGNGAANRLTGGAGQDSLEGMGGSDTLMGGLGNDALVGGALNDSLVGGDGTDWLSGDEGDDKLFGDGGADTLLGGLGLDKLDGGEGADLLDGGLGNDALTGGGGADTLLGGAGADILTGGDGVDVLDGGEGNDIIFGDGGAESLVGGAGADRLNGGADADTLVGGEGNDILSGDDGIDSLVGGAGDDNLKGGTEGDLLDGGAGRDLLDGGAGDDTLTGGTEDDKLFGRDGADSLEGGSGNDLLTAGAGDDALIGDDGADILNGEDGNDSLAGGAGLDKLSGGNGADLLIGGAGDTLIGGLGADQFFFVAPEAGACFIKDFNALDGGAAEGDTLGFHSLLVGEFAYLGSGAFSGQQHTEARVAGNQVLVDCDGDGQADLTLTLTGLTHAAQLQASDFFFLSAV